MKKLFVCLLLIISSTINIACGTELGDDFKMIAKVLDVGEKIEVEVVESDNNASGIYLVITANETKYFDIKGNKISKENIEIGDIVEIYYGGQVMMSYPPQIVAARIVVK